MSTDTKAYLKMLRLQNQVLKNCKILGLLL